MKDEPRSDLKPLDFTKKPSLRMTFKDDEPIDINRLLDEKSISIVNKANARLEDLPSGDLNLKLAQIPHMVTTVKKAVNLFKNNQPFNRATSLKVNPRSFTVLSGELFRTPTRPSKLVKDDLAQSVSASMGPALTFDRSRSDIPPTLVEESRGGESTGTHSEILASKLEQDFGSGHTYLNRPAVLDRFGPAKNKSAPHLLNRLIEDFYILGPQKSEAMATEASAELVYYFSYKLGEEQGADPIRQLQQLTSYIIPFGHTKSATEDLALSVQRVSEILFARQNCASKFEFFHIPLISNVLGKGFEQVYEEDFARQPAKFAVLRECNPESLYYYYCARYEDFYVSVGPREARGGPVRMQLHFFPRFYVFKTVYPFSTFYHSLFRQMLGTLFDRRLQRLAGFVAEGTGAEFFLPLVDADGFAEEEARLVRPFLSELQRLTITDNFNAPLEIRPHGLHITYQTPQREALPLCAAEDSYARVLSLFAFEEFVLVYLAVLAQKNVVFVSRSLRKLSATISCFLALISPLQWVFPLIYSLPRDCFDFVSSPIPMIIGINLESRAFYEKVFPSFQVNESLSVVKSDGAHLFVLLDQMAFDFDPGLLDTLYFPNEKGYVRGLREIYRKNVNALESDFVRVRKSTFRSLNTYRLEKVRRTKVRDYIEKYDKLKVPRPVRRPAKDGQSNPIALVNYVTAHFQNIVLPKIRRLDESKNLENVKNRDFFIKSLMNSQSFQAFREKTFGIPERSEKSSVFSF